jgi:TfoX/Sxy family transcriptional regulator of competence genes
MLSTRIQYTLSKDGYSEYSNDILANNKVVVANVTKDGYYVVVDKETQAVIKISKCKSLTSAKRNVKVYLRDIGANFYDEVRSRKFKTGCD